MTNTKKLYNWLMAREQLDYGPGIEAMRLAVELFDWISPLVKKPEDEYYA